MQNKLQLYNENVLGKNCSSCHLKAFTIDNLCVFLVYISCYRCYVHFAILQCNTIVHSSKQVFCRLSVYSWEGRRALSYTKSYILINFMVHLHYYQSPIQISIRDSIVHGRMFHYLICISIDLRGTICTSICQSRARNTTPDYETHKRKL